MPIPNFILIAIVIFSSSLALCTDFLCQSAFTTATFNKNVINKRLASAAGLHYLDPHEKNQSDFTGIHRSLEADGSGFYYTDSSGKKITETTVIERLAALKIPPGWQKVWISTDPRSHLQATGLDSKGRKQFRYHDLWQAKVKDVAKFERMKRFGQALPHLRTRVDLDLNKPQTELNHRLALIVWLLENTGIRIGGEKYAKENQHFGLTTLQTSHVISGSNKNSSVELQFVGKEGVSHHKIITDIRIAKSIAHQAKNKDPHQLLFDVSDEEVNNYIKMLTSEEFSAKDFRTWVGTTTAIKTLLEALPSDHSTKDFYTEWEQKASAAAAYRLGNKPTTAKENYIDPIVFAAFQNGTLQFRARIWRDQFRQSEVHHQDLQFEEQVYLFLLEQDRKI